MTRRIDNDDFGRVRPGFKPADRDPLVLAAADGLFDSLCDRYRDAAVVDMRIRDDGRVTLMVDGLEK
jgi:hypothetical protein